ncbi:MAG TPA: PIN domain nuclease [Clostridiaceae bacterium]|nr:PIN domain nuclease [Clostridiaceae bacterium]
MPLADIWPGVGGLLTVLLNILAAIMGANVAIKKKEEILGFFHGIRHRGQTKEKAEKEKEKAVYNGTPKVLDTSVIIDGRIYDICKTGFIEGKLVIPFFVLEELRHIADSSDSLKRNRGRRGLDILNKIQNELDIEVEIWEKDFPEIAEVDSKLLKLATVLQGKVVTNDYNLNKVAEFQRVPVLNINEMANAVKPMLLPGEELNLLISKVGKEQNQGIGYRDDGTMIVVEDGKRYVGSTIYVIVTSVLQTAAGRMIFAKPKVD